MRTTYHIVINREEEAQLERILKHFGTEPSFKASMNTSDSQTFEYLVDLSKYELLYLRLSCSGKIIEVDTHEKILHTVTVIPS
jgi:hypothetical protein